MLTSSGIIFERIKRTMRRINLIFLVLTLLPGLSCEDTLVNSFPADVSFDVSYRMLEGKKISCIEADQKGNVAISFRGKALLPERR